MVNTGWTMMKSIEVPDSAMALERWSNSKGLVEF